jgi:hypothetical protein
MVLLAELAELLVLIAISLVLIVGIVFRPTDAGRSRSKLAVSAREEAAREVLGPAPTREAAQIYRKLLRDARNRGITINWEEARSEQMTIRPARSLVATARRQIS